MSSQSTTSNLQRRAAEFMRLDQESLTWDADFRNWVDQQRQHKPVIQDAMNFLTEVREHDRCFNPDFACKATEEMPPQGSLMFGNGWALNREAIINSRTYQMGLLLPAGPILHMHQNTGVKVKTMLEFAKKNVRKNLFVNSSILLRTAADFDTCEIILEVMPQSTTSKNCFARGFNCRQPAAATKPVDWMHYDAFVSQFKTCRGEAFDVDAWLIAKIELTTADCCSTHSNCNTMWSKFNAGTRGFKGLFGFYSGFRNYYYTVMEHAAQQQIPYMEHRIMVLDTKIKTDAGEPGLDLVEQMKLIKSIGEEIAAKYDTPTFKFLGVKIIGGIPRVLSPKLYTICLATIRKLAKACPDMFVGADILGCEDRDFSFPYEVLEEHDRLCAEEGLVIPWLPHAGESFNMYPGGNKPKEHGLAVALSLGSKRIGHGYALARHPAMMAEVAKRGVFVECMPISNEKLGLAPTPMAHPYPIMLMAGVKLVISNDNFQIQRNHTLYHDDMYQLFVGWSEMTGYGLAQMAKWAIDGSCLSSAEKLEATRLWYTRFIQACYKLVDQARVIRPAMEREREASQ